MANKNLTAAKSAKNDEFYTQFDDIQKELNNYYEYNPDFLRGKVVLCPCDDPSWSNFTKFFALNANRFGIKKLISTSYAPDSKRKNGVSLANGGFTWGVDKVVELNGGKDESRESSHGKIYIWDELKGKVFKDEDDFARNCKWKYLQGDGDFRSDEVKALRDEADVIITNPPFSLFREFVSWIREKDENKKFLIIGNMNAITYKEVFPLIKENKLWIGTTNFNTGMYFYVPDSFEYTDTYKFERSINGKKVSRVPSVCWFTNLDHGFRHKPLDLNTKEFNELKNKKIKEMGGYQKYDNYDAIEVPEFKAIPCDYDGVMGVPISFLDKYCPEQFEIVSFRKGEDGKDLVFTRERERIVPYFRVLIKRIG